MKELNYIQLDNITGELIGIIRASGDWITKRPNVVEIVDLAIEVTPETHYLDVSYRGLEIKRKVVPTSDPRFPVERLPRPTRPKKVSLLLEPATK